MFPRLKLSAKFNLILALVFLGGLGLSVIALNQALAQLAEEEVRQQSQLLLQTMNGVRDYTSGHVRPIIEAAPDDDSVFISETVPAFSARQVITNVRQADAYQKFNYKEATLNPTNPADQADAFETGLIEQFRADPDLQELSGFRTVNGERVFYSARPMAVNDESCLACHSTPEQAPPALISTYGTEGGFGWQLGEVVAAQMVYVPAGNVTQLARAFMTAVLGVVVAAFAVTMLASNALLRSTVISPVGELARVARVVADGSLSPEAFQTAAFAKITNREDELGQLGRVFQQMAEQVYLREQELKARVRQLEIVIDENKLHEQVDAITDTDYFRDLQDRANDLRTRRSEDEEDA